MIQIFYYYELAFFLVVYKIIEDRAKERRRSGYDSDGGRGDHCAAAFQQRIAERVHLRRFRRANGDRYSGLERLRQTADTGRPVNSQGPSPQAAAAPVFRAPRGQDLDTRGAAFVH